MNQHPPTYTYTHAQTHTHTHIDSQYKSGSGLLFLLLQNMKLRIILLLLALSCFVLIVRCSKLCGKALPNITVHLKLPVLLLLHTMMPPPGENQNKLKEKRAKAKRNKNNDAHTCSSYNCRCALESVCESNNPQSKHLPIRISELEQLYRLNHFHFCILWAAVSIDLYLGCY